MSSELKYWYLREHKLFKNLSSEEIDSLCILNRFARSKKDEMLRLPQSDKERIYLLKQGTIKLVRHDANGFEMAIDLVQKGDLFGELNLAGGSGVEEYFRVVSDEAIMCTFYREKLENIIASRPDFALSYISFMGLTFRKMQNEYKNILFKDARSRLLLLLSKLIGEDESATNTFILPNYLTQKDIAQLICTTRQTVISLFKELEREGIVSYTQKEITISDVSQLKKLIEKVK